METSSFSRANLAAEITRAASKQTYYTIRFLVDPDRIEDAYRSYAYFRWVDDWLDRGDRPRVERLNFVQRQKLLIDSCYYGEKVAALAPEEQLLVDLIHNNPQRGSGLEAYIRNMMAVMAFDAERRGRLSSQQELCNYTFWLAAAVTENLHYFIGHGCDAPQDETRYLAVTGAHITHMLRDALDDVGEGYYNIPKELLAAHGSDPRNTSSPAYQAWVKNSVSQARACFKAGRDYLSRVENMRCRIAGYSYIHRFEIVLKYIERENFSLRSQYPERKSARSTLQMLGWATWMALRYQRPLPVPSAITVR